MPSTLSGYLHGVYHVICSNGESLETAASCQQLQKVYRLKCHVQGTAGWEKLPRKWLTMLTAEGVEWLLVGRMILVQATAKGRMWQCGVNGGGDGPGPLHYSPPDVKVFL
jgi:hypothetical protein